MAAAPVLEFPELDGAACKDIDPEDFFDSWSAALARRVCRECPVAAACLDWALTHHEFGIWGGTSEEERAVLRRRTGRSHA